MADGLNRCEFLGNLGSDPELKMTQGGSGVLKMSLAVNSSYLDSNNTRQERVEWVRLTVFGKRAEALARHLSKGDRIYVAGEMRTSKYEKNGVDHYSTEVIVGDLIFAGSRRPCASRVRTASRAPSSRTSSRKTSLPSRWLPENEVRAMLETLPAKRRPLFAFLVSTGATYPSEVQDVRPGHVKGHVVHLPGTKAGTRDRYVHVPSYGREFLKAALRGLRSTGFEPWGNIRRDLHVAAGHAGIEPLSPNDLRRTFAQWLVRSGVPYELAAPMMGHGSTKMLEQVYGKRDPAAVARLVDAALKKAPKKARMA